MRGYEINAPQFGQGGSEKIATGRMPSNATELGLALGASYDDERWDSLLAQMTRNEAAELVGHGPTGAAPAVNSIGLPSLTAFDGPSQIGGFTSAGYRTTGYPNATVMAQTWNIELIMNFGTTLGGKTYTLTEQYGMPALSVTAAA